MNRNTKTLLIITLTGIMFWAFSGAVYARTEWVMGTVTKGPWVETHRHMEVDGVKYTFMPRDVNMEKHYQSYSGIWQKEDISFRDIRVGQKVMIRIQGRRIYELYIEDY